MQECPRLQEPAFTQTVPMQGLQGIKKPESKHGHMTRMRPINRMVFSRRQCRPRHIAPDTGQDNISRASRFRKSQDQNLGKILPTHFKFNSCHIIRDAVRLGLYAARGNIKHHEGRPWIRVKRTPHRTRINKSNRPRLAQERVVGMPDKNNISLSGKGQFQQALGRCVRRDPVANAMRTAMHHKHVLPTDLKAYLKRQIAQILPDIRRESPMRPLENENLIFFFLAATFFLAGIFNHGSDIVIAPDHMRRPFLDQPRAFIGKRAIADNIAQAPDSITIQRLASFKDSVQSGKIGVDVRQ